MFGAIAASGVLPFGRDACEAVIRGIGARRRGEPRRIRARRARRSTRGETARSSRRDRVSRRPPAPVPDGDPRGVSRGGARHRCARPRARRRVPGPRATASSISSASRACSPPSGRAIPAGRARLRADARDGALSRVVDGVRRHRPRRRPEVPRQPLCAGAPRSRARGDGDVVRIFDYFKPGMPEVRGAAAARAGGAARRVGRRRQARGKAAARIRADALARDGIAGFLALRTLAALRWLRRRGARFAQEQAVIERWLDGDRRWPPRTTGRSRTRSRCAARLVKGYGATNERGKATCAHPRPSRRRAATPERR